MHISTRSNINKNHFSLAFYRFVLHWLKAKRNGVQESGNVNLGAFNCGSFSRFFFFSYQVALSCSIYNRDTPRGNSSQGKPTYHDCLIFFTENIFFFHATYRANYLSKKVFQINFFRLKMMQPQAIENIQIRCF